jgi:hypothetical protein
VSNEIASALTGIGLALAVVMGVKAFYMYFYPRGKYIMRYPIGSLVCCLIGAITASVSLYNMEVFHLGEYLGASIITLAVLTYIFINEG